MTWLLIVGGLVAVLVLSVKGQAGGTGSSGGGGGAPGGGAPGGAAPGGAGGGCAIMSDPGTWPSGDRIWDICRAVGIAEGANVPGSAPDRYNNPGDLSSGDEGGQAISGYTTLPDGENLIVFSSKSGGWAALYRKFSNIAAGRSSVYSADWNWYQIGSKYAGNSQAWSTNVASALGVDPGTTMNDYLQGTCMANADLSVNPGGGCLYGGCGSCG